jgi:hypothetical protein
MDGEREVASQKLVFLDQLKGFAASEEAYGRLRADFQDLLEASEWFSQTVRALAGRTLSVSELEDLLVEIDVKFVEHASFHLETLRGDLKAALENFPNEDGPDSIGAGVKS